MEPVTLSMLANTVFDIVPNLGNLIKAARNNDKMLAGCEEDLSSLKAITEQVKDALTIQSIKDMISQASADNIVAGLVANFRDCDQFLKQLEESIKTSKSSGTRIMRFAHATMKGEDRLRLKQQLVERKLAAHIGFEIITLLATCEIPNYVEESSSKIVESIKSLENMLKELRRNMRMLNNGSTSSVALSTPTALARVNPALPLEEAAREAIKHAMVVWKEQRNPRPGSDHTVETQVHRGRSTARVSRTRRSDGPDRPAIIAVCGMTGSGKSRFISTVAGTDIGTGHGLQSETSEGNEGSVTVDGRCVSLVDTPGFADTNVSDTDVLRMIAQWMERSYRGEAHLSDIIYLHQIYYNRVDGPSLRNIELFRKLCGEGGLSNVILATTMWDTGKTVEDIKTFEMREEQLIQDFWKRMIDKGSQVRRYYNSRESALDLIHDLMRRDTVTLDIQKELVDDGKALGDTAAGSYIDEEIQKMMKKHQEELEELLRMMETSTESARHEITQEYNKILEKMRASEEETRLLHEHRLHEISRKREEEARARADDSRAYEKKLKDVQKTHEANTRESNKQAASRVKSCEEELKRIQDKNFTTQMDLAKQYEQQKNNLQKNLEANSFREKDALARQLDENFRRQQHASNASANQRIDSLADQVQRLGLASASKDDRIQSLAHQLQVAKGSNNNNNINSGNSRSYHNHLNPMNGGSSSGGARSNGATGGGGGGYRNIPHEPSRSVLSGC
ncbi:hypothetical protein AAFC00_002727 [Neodothiora populina]|uniref:G domain-containing protein n=1 Tax=Neodothiora populina TaxID=2781224 RepID=A0ABR3P816_9PEZI